MDEFYSHKIVGKMKQVPKGRPIKGSPEIHPEKRGDTFYDSARYGASPIQGSPGSGIPSGLGGMDRDFESREEPKGKSIKGSKNVEKGNEYESQ